MSLAKSPDAQLGPSHVCPHPLAMIASGVAAAQTDIAPLRWHMWAVGALTLIWYALGLGQLGVMGSAAQTSTFLSQASLAVCLWSGLGGAVLLLMRSRYAVQAMVVALVGVLTASLDLFVLASRPVDFYANPTFLSLWLIAQVSLYYTLRIRSLGLLK
ncbi:MAG: hypothetical protein AAF697_07500 [Pseudomonadota bacterium]